MAGFEPISSVIRSDHTADCATTTAHQFEVLSHKNTFKMRSTAQATSLRCTDYKQMFIKNTGFMIITIATAHNKIELKYFVCSCWFYHNIGLSYLEFAFCACSGLAMGSGTGPIKILFHKFYDMQFFKHFDRMLIIFNQSKCLKKSRIVKFTL